MKKLALNLTLLLCVFTLSAQEVEETNPGEKTFKNSLRVHPLNVFVNELVVDYERVISEKSSLNFTLALGYEDFGVAFPPSGSREDYLVFLQADYRYYFSKSKIAPRGFFASGGVFGFNEHIRYRDLPGTVSPNFSQDFFTAGVSADIGYQWVFDKGITIGLSGGANAQVPVNYDNSTIQIKPDLNITIGYSW